MKKGDFSSLANNYAKYRPSYNMNIVRHILFATEKSPESLRVADVGSGTGIFAKCLYEANVKNITAVEPNDSMRNAGIVVQNKEMNWVKGWAEETKLPSSFFDLVSMASSFHWANTVKALAELNRLLTDSGTFAVLWNPRLTEKSKVESAVQSLLTEKYGVKSRMSSGRSGITNNLREILEDCGYFQSIVYLDAVDIVYRSHEEYLGAWRSVNEIQAELGIKKFNEFIEEVKKILADFEQVEVHYLTRAWLAKK